jgi:uncharacterized membrane protein
MLVVPEIQTLEAVVTYLRTPLVRWRRLGVGVGLVLSAAACGGDDDNGGVVTPTPSIAVSAGTATVNVTAGQSGTSAITLTRNGGYTGAVNLAVTGAPAGVTATFNPASVASGSTTSTLTLATTAATAAGTYPLVVTASGTGVANATTQVSLVVTAAPASGFTIAPAAALTVTQGAAAQNATINITRTGGFAGAVTLTTGGTIPAGLTVTPAAATTGNTATVAVSATSAAAPGTYPITINATGAGITGTQTTTLNVTVAAAQAAQDFTISAANVSVAQGGTAQNAVVTIARTGGFTGGVTLTTSGAPAGLTVTAPAAAVTEGTANIAVTATSAIAPGTYPITVSATGAGVTGTKTATFNVTVTPAVSVGNYTLGTSGNVTVQQGQSATTTLNVTRTGGFAGGVQVTQSGAPSGVTVTVTPNPVTGNTATVTVAAATGATTGNATITLTGAATGLANQTTTFTVNVTAASTGGGNVGLNFCAAEAPIWVGFQNEGGAWQRATLNANNQAQVNITAARGAIAYVVQAGSGATASYTTNVTYGSAAELTTFGANLCGNVAGGKSVTGTVAGVGQTDQVAITLGDASAEVTGSSFRINEVQPGPRDLLAVRSSLDLATFSITPNRIIVRRNQNIANGGTIPVIDFNSTEAVTPASARITVSGLGANEAALPFVSLQTANGASAPFFTGLGAVLGGGTGPQTYYGLPTSSLAAGDLHLATVIAFPRSGQEIDATQGRIIAQYFRTVSDRTVTLGPSLNVPTVTSTTSPYPRPRVQLARQGQYGDAFAATFTQAGTTSRALSMVALASYLQGGSTWDLTFPDFTGAAGFDPAWMLRSGTRTDWQVIASGGTGITQVGQVPTEGATFSAALRSGTLTTTARAVGFAVRQPLSARAATVDGIRREALRASALADRAVRGRR